MDLCQPVLIACIACTVTDFTWQWGNERGQLDPIGVLVRRMIAILILRGLHSREVSQCLPVSPCLSRLLA